MSDNAFKDFRLFPAISEAWELTRSGLVIIREELYKLELCILTATPIFPITFPSRSKKTAHGPGCPTRHLPRGAMEMRLCVMP